MKNEKRKTEPNEERKMKKEKRRENVSLFSNSTTPCSLVLFFLLFSLFFFVTACDEFWDLFETDGDEKEEEYLPITGGAYTPETVLLSTQWNQNTPYNNLIPNGYPTGCTATATAQIMKYYEHPKGALSGTLDGYTTSSGISIPATNLNTVSFDWNNMRDTYRNNNYSTAEANAVANLMFVIGKAWQIDYDDDGSSGSFDIAIMRENFKYTNGIRRLRRDEVGDNFNNILLEQIDSLMPVYYSAKRTGGGHAFIFDGYNKSGEFHVNWGWGGSSDDWYSTSALIPTTMTSRNYNQDHYAYINIMPANTLSNSLSNALDIIESATYTTTMGSAANAAQAKTRVTETIQSLNLGAGITFKVYDVGASPFPLTDGTIGSETTGTAPIKEYKFVVSVTKEGVTFTSGILTLKILNFAGGNGTEQSPYEISNPDQLKTLAMVVNINSISQFPIRDAYKNKHYKLTSNINLSSYGNWTPIGASTTRAFFGIFDGNGKVITGLTINTTSDYQGLFGYLGGTVKNLGLENINIKGGNYTGAIAGYAGNASDTNPYSGIISNCYTTGSITGKVRVGGIAAAVTNSGSVLENCYSTVTINATERVGGIVGSVGTGSVVRNNAALNQSLIGDLIGSAETDPRTFRVIGAYSTGSVFENNIAYSDMLVNGAKVPSTDTSHRNGADFTAAQVAADGTLGVRFTAPVWTTQDSKLPGFGSARELPGYLSNEQ